MKKLLLSLALAVSGFLGLSAETATITFADLGYANSEPINGSPITVGDITLTFDKSGGSNDPAYYTSGTAARIYSKNTFTVQTEGYNIEKIVFTAAGNSYVVKDGYQNVGNLLVSGSTSTWTGSSSEVIFTNSGSAQIRLTKIEVTYTSTGGGDVTPKTNVALSFPENSYTVTLGDSFVEPTLSCDNEAALAAVEYSSSNPLVASVDVETGDVEILAAGETKISASIPSNNETYTSNTAVYTLTVKKPAVVGQGSYTIEFKENTSDGSGALTAANFMNQVVSGSEYIASVSSSTVYPGISGLKFSSSKTNGTVTINLADAGIVDATSIIINAAKYGSDAASLSVNGSAAQTMTGTTLTEYEFALSDATELSSITLSATKRLYVQAITVVYGEGGGPVVEKVEPVEISYVVNGASADVTMSCATEGATIYYGTSEDAITNEYTGTFTVTEGCTIYAFAQKGEGKSAVKSAKITLPFASFKAAIEGSAHQENIEIVGNFSVIYNSGVYLMLTDGTSNILVYGLSNAPAAGTAISKVSGTVNIYQKLFELTNAEISVGGTGAEIEPTVLTTFAGLDIVNNIFDYVTIKGCSIVNQSGKNATVKLGDEEFALYNNFGIGSFENGSNLTITAFVWRYNDNFQLSPVEITKAADPGKQDPDLSFDEHQITFDMADTDGGMIQGQVVNAPEGVEVVYTSSNKEGLDVDEDGMLYVYATGTYTITAYTEGNDSYNEGWASYTVVVTNKYVLGDITVNGVVVEEEASIEVKVGDKITIAAENAEALDIEIIGVNSNDNDFEDIVISSYYEWTVAAADTYMISVEAEGVNKDKKTLNFTIVATEEKPVISNTVTLDFVNNDYGMIRYTTGNTFNPDPITLTETEGLEVVAVGKTRLWTDGFRLYTGSFVTITAPDKYIIADVEKTAKSSFDTEFSENGKQWTVSCPSSANGKAIQTITVTLGLDPERVSPVYENFIIEPNGIGGYTIKVSHDFEGVSVHYKHTPAESEAVEARRAVDHSGYTKAELDEEGNHAFTVDGPGVVEYYGYHTDTDTKGSVRTLKINSDGSTTSISEINAAVKANDAVYDLMGRKVSAPVRGLYIVNGAKHVVR